MNTRQIVQAWPVPTAAGAAGHVYGVRYADGGTGWVPVTAVPFGFRVLRCRPAGCGVCGVRS